MLQHHAANEFPFLDDPANARNRTTLHSILARLLFMEDTPGKFKTFVAPFQQVSIVLQPVWTCVGLQLQLPF